MNERTTCGPVFNPDFSETVAYNNPLFPVYVQYGILSSYPDYSAISHWHDDLEFILVKRGAMTYHVNGESIKLSKNNGILVNSRQLHYGFSGEHKECEFICILVSPKLLQGNEWFYHNFIGYITENPSYPYLYLDGSSWKKSVLDRIDRLYRSYSEHMKKPDVYFELLEEFLSIMKLLYVNLHKETSIPVKEASELASVRSMISYIEEHFSERLTLESIAASGTCCKSRCSMLFKKYLRDTPVTYMTKLRLGRSLAALLDTDKSITDIAFEYGFCGASYYCETFKKYYGMSPLGYRKMHTGRQ